MRRPLSFSEPLRFEEAHNQLKHQGSPHHLHQTTAISTKCSLPELGQLKVTATTSYPYIAGPGPKLQASNSGKWGDRSFSRSGPFCQTLAVGDGGKSGEEIMGIPHL